MGDNVIGGQNIICLNDVGGRTLLLFIMNFPIFLASWGGGGGGGGAPAPCLLHLCS